MKRFLIFSDIRDSCPKQPRACACGVCSIMSDSLQPLSVGFSRQEYCKGCHFLLQGIFPPRDQTHVSSIDYIAGRFFITRANWEALSQSVSSVAQSCLTLCDPMNRSTPGLPVHHQLPEFTQTPVHRVGDAIQPSHPLSSPSPPASNPSQHQGLFQ